MIRISRAPLPQTALKKMVGYTGDIGQAPVPRQRAGELWKHTTVRRHIHPVLRSTLAEMAPA
jgi:hypothetical protein